MQKQVSFEKDVKTKYPEQIVIIVAKDKNGKANPVTMGWTLDDDCRTQKQTFCLKKKLSANLRPAKRAK
jgi:hypothetical protein